ncbi:solute carrier organic anion transporter family member 2B1-like [Liolophura sinensis]|uniref:solute carrier organic anion transporter family member 2B1-like n=1 Tax=Liolophura sinensis TaxID=3198878 RepID=UPI0031583088
MAGVGGLCVNLLRIYISSQISTIEKQFGFSSAKSGSLKIGYSVGYLIFVIPASHLGSTSHRPRILGAIYLMIGVAGILAALPHFILKPRQFRPSSLNKSDTPIWGLTMLCRNDSLPANLTDVENCEAQEGSSYISGSWIAYGLLATSYLLQGMANGPKTSLQISYVDDNVEKHSTGYSVGIMTFLSILGGVAAFLLGGLFNRLYVNLYDPGFGPKDPRWIGAWWLGFLVFGTMSAIWSVSFFFSFPKRINRHEEGRTEKAAVKKKKKKKRSQHMKDLLPALGRLVKNPAYCCNVLAQTLTSFGLWGKLSFMTKYIEIQFEIPTWKSNVIVAMASAAVADIGALTAGVLVSRLRLNPLNMFKLMIIAFTLSTAARAGMTLFACSDKLEIDVLKQRCVDKEDKAVALGCMAFVKRVMGELPSGTVFGLVIDSTCSVWNRTCEGTGACALYDNQSLRFGYLGLWAGLKFLATVASVVGYLFERKRLGDHQTVEKTDVDEEMIINTIAI